MKKLLLFGVLFALLWFPLVASQPSLQTSSSVTPDNLFPGCKGFLTISVMNSGTSTAKSVTIRINPTLGIKFQRYEFNLGYLEPGKSKQISVSFEIDENVRKPNLVVFYTVTYGEVPEKKTIDSSVGLTITEKPQIEVAAINFTDEELEPGDEATMHLLIKNSGLCEARDVSVTVDFDNSPISLVNSGNVAYLGKLTSGSSKATSFQILVDREAEVRTYPLTIQVSYLDCNGNEETKTYTASIKVYGKPEIDVILDETTNFYPGISGRSEITITVANRGVGSARFVSLKFDSDLPLMKQQEYIGTIDPDDYESVDIPVNLQNVKPGTYTLNVTVSFKDPYNNLMVKETSLTIIVPQKTQGMSYTIYVVLLILLAIAVWKAKKFLKQGK